MPILPQGVDREFATALSKWLWTVPKPHWEWAEALFAGAMDELQPNPDPHKALAMAITMYAENPEPPTGTPIAEEPPTPDIVTHGSSTSGNFNHPGRPGQVGGSGPGGQGEDYRLKDYDDEEFGLKDGPKAYEVQVNRKTLDPLVDEWIDKLGEDAKSINSFLKEKGISPPPKGWTPDQAFEVVALVSGEFTPLMPEKGTFTSKELGRSLMQVVEAYSEPDAYIGKEAGIPQSLKAFEKIATWFIDNKLIGDKASKPFTEGYFSVESAKASLDHIKRMRNPVENTNPNHDEKGQSEES